MMDEKLIASIVEEVLAQLQREGRLGAEALSPGTGRLPEPEEEKPLVDIVSPQVKAVPLLKDPRDPEALLRMKARTTARIGVGRAGPRLNTQTLLTLRADHAKARDAVFLDVDPGFLKELGLFTVQTKSRDKNQHLTRPDLGREFDDQTKETLRQRCAMNPDVQIFASDGLSSAAIEANLKNILPVLTDGLKARGITVGTPFFVRFGRVAAQDHVSELLGPKVVCTLIGERPGLGSAESMSAYICYNARVGQPEARRTVVSNIHKDGISAVEAGAYIAELIEKILKAKASGVELQQ